MSTVADLFREDAATYDRKAADYAPNADDPFENFTFSGTFSQRLMRGASGAMGAKQYAQLLACCVLIGVKISRLQTLGLFGKANNEGALDTIGDLRVYLGILEMQIKGSTEAPK